MIPVGRSAGEVAYEAQRQRRDDELENRLRRAYGIALRHAHEAGSVQIHASSDVIEDIKALGAQRTGTALAAPTMLFGFPIIPADEHLGLDHLSVHVVHLID